MNNNTPLTIRALNYDLARCRRADLPHLKAVVDQLAECGYNMLSLYLEHRFELPSCPGVAPAGSLTTVAAQELVAYGQTRGIAVIPQFNLIGHCEGIGATERYAHLTCDPYEQMPWGGYEQLNLNLPEARKFVRNAIADICTAFPGDTVHIGGDEVRQMAWLFPGEPERQLETMYDWLLFVINEAKRHGRKTIMWGDMLLHHESLMAKMPRDVIICDWQYGPKGSRATLERFQKEGFTVLAAPAVSTCPMFGVSVEGSLQNITAMVGDAYELGLHGFLLTTWEFGFGSGSGQIWPFVAYAGAVAQGQRPEGEAFLADYAHRRYGVDGTAFMQLHAVVNAELEAALMHDLKLRPALLQVQLRKALFRGASPFSGVARLQAAPANHHRPVWEPGPFGCWLFLRAVLTPALIVRLEALAAKGEALAARLRQEAVNHSDELESLFGLAAALSVMVEGLKSLQAAKGHYRAAALAQGTDQTLFRTGLDRAAACLEQLNSGLERLRSVVATLDRTIGLDAGEQIWLDIHAKSLHEHVAALRQREFESDTLIEFGEFLRRPAHVTPRLTWR